MEDELKPLSLMQDGQKGIVMSLGGGQEFQSRIISMGIFPGCEIEVLKNGNRAKGPVLTAIGSSRIMVGHGMTQKILVEVD